MLGQLSFDAHGNIRDKVENAIFRLKAFEPPEGYYVAFSGGKDSQCVYHLCKMAGVKFDAHYSVTSVDPPELVRFIKDKYPEVKFERRYNKEGKPITMWSLIPEKLMPPTRVVRYCCDVLKENNGGKYRYTLTGVRWAESANRKKNQGVITIPQKGKKYKLMLMEKGVNFTPTIRGGVVLNFDNADDQELITTCMRTDKTLVNPIIDWEEEDVWEFLNSNGIEHCCLYDEGFKRLGCIGCPMSRKKGMERDFARWPKYRENYLKTFERLIKARKEKGLPCVWEKPEEVLSWWLGEQ